MEKRKLNAWNMHAFEFGSVLISVNILPFLVKSLFDNQSSESSTHAPRVPTQLAKSVKSEFYRNHANGLSAASLIGYISCI